ncbi:MAG: hypothetical protein B6U97_02225 [Candidatus Altiarchaeales archaeon ex4484_96]|nr:MAG: hypothetical protein B6U97_02225 [Candidatus Altiarchaeales archaeon ex4484_96]
MKSKTERIIPIIVLILAAFQTASAQTVNKTDSLDIIVTVSNLTLVDINPANLTWVNIPPGTESNSTYAAAGNKEAIQIENIGSTNISNIWFNVTHPSIMPFGSGNRLNYNPANFVIIRRNTSNEWYFIDRLEYNESELIYLELPTGSSSDPNMVHGRLRSADSEYFWVMNISDGSCNDTQFWIGNAPHTQTSTGTVDFTACGDPLTGAGTPGDCRTGSFTPVLGGAWGALNLSLSDTPIENYTVITPAVCGGTNVSVRFNHWNMDAPGAQSGSYTDYFYTTALVPGEHIIANVKIRVPYGTMAGTLPTGQLTVIAQAVGVTS